MGAWHAVAVIDLPCNSCLALNRRYDSGEFSVCVCNSLVWVWCVSSGLHVVECGCMEWRLSTLFTQNIYKKDVLHSGEYNYNNKDK